MGTRGCGDAAQAKKKIKKFVYRSFTQQVADLDVNVFKRVGRTRHEPLSGAGTFFAEAINEWRELNTAHDFTALCQVAPPPGPNPKSEGTQGLALRPPPVQLGWPC